MVAHVVVKAPRGVQDRHGSILDASDVQCAVLVRYSDMAVMALRSEWKWRGSLLFAKPHAKASGLGLRGPNEFHPDTRP